MARLARRATAMRRDAAEGSLHALSSKHARTRRVARFVVPHFPNQLATLVGAWMRTSAGSSTVGRQGRVGGGGRWRSRSHRSGAVSP